MTRKLFMAALGLMLISQIFAQGYKVGDTAIDFKLKNVNEKTLALADMPSAKGYIVIFTCNHCPYAQAYEQRIIDLDKKYSAKGYPVIAINPNDPKVQPEDSFAEMQKRARQKKYSFPYLFDSTQDIAKAYGATRTPQVYLLRKTAEGNVVEYIGAIDNNTEDGSKADQKYVEIAVDALLAGRKPETTYTRAIGCTIKWKKDSE